MTDSATQVAALAALYSPSSWQPVDAAPSGVMCLFADMGATEARHWAFVGWRHSQCVQGCVALPSGAQRPATHFMSLPEPPRP